MAGFSERCAKDMKRDLKDGLRYEVVCISKDNYIIAYMLIQISLAIDVNVRAPKG